MSITSKPARLLVLGASGFLGRHVRQQAEAAGMTVVTACRSALPGSPQHLQLDLVQASPDVLAATITAVAPDAVVNCAGATAGSPDVLAAANVCGPFALAQAMLRTRPAARLVHLGSAAEYGPPQTSAPLAETAPARPAGTYGVTKLAGTRLVELARCAGLTAVVLRVFNPVGAGAPDSSLPGAVAAQLRRARSGGGEIRLGSLDAVRDFVDARDVAAAVLAAVAAAQLPSPLLNIGSGTAVPARTLVKQLVEVSGFTGPVHEDAPGSARSAGLAGQRADIARARAELGWRPRYDLAASAADLWETASESGIR